MDHGVGREVAEDSGRGIAGRDIDGIVTHSNQTRNVLWEIGWMIICDDRVTR